MSSILSMKMTVINLIKMTCFRATLKHSESNYKSVFLIKRLNMHKRRFELVGNPVTYDSYDMSSYSTWTHQYLMAEPMGSHSINV